MALRSLATVLYNRPLVLVAWILFTVALFVLVCRLNYAH